MSKASGKLAQLFGDGHHFQTWRTNVFPVCDLSIPAAIPFSIRFRFRCFWRICGDFLETRLTETQIADIRSVETLTAPYIAKPHFYVKLIGGHVDQ